MTLYEIKISDIEQYFFSPQIYIFEEIHYLTGNEFRVFNVKLTNGLKEIYGLFFNGILYSIGHHT